MTAPPLRMAFYDLVGCGAIQTRATPTYRDGQSISNTTATSRHDEDSQNDGSRARKRGRGGFVGREVRFLACCIIALVSVEGEWHE